MATTPANATNALTTGQVSFSGTAFSASTLTQFDVLVGGASNAISSIGPGTAGQVLQSAGNAANPAYSTATYPSTATSVGTLLIADGTNWGATTTTTINSVGSILSAGSSSGGTTTIQSSNTSNTATSDALLSAIVAGTSGGDPHVRFSITSGEFWCMGSDNSDSDSLKINTDTSACSPSTGTNIMKMLSTGEVTAPLQPSFLAIRSANVLNVTGNATTYTTICDTEVYDTNADYNNGTGVFTAPITGKYLFTENWTILGCTIANNISAGLVTSNRSYRANNIRTASNNNLAIAYSQITDMDAADTVSFTVSTSGEAGDTDDFYGDGTTAGSWISGILLH